MRWVDGLCEVKRFGNENPLMHSATANAFKRDVR